MVVRDYKFVAYMKIKGYEYEIKDFLCEVDIDFLNYEKELSNYKRDYKVLNDKIMNELKKIHNLTPK